MQKITTATHDIRAEYGIDSTGEWRDINIDTNGDTFNEIVADMLALWNNSDNRAEEFTVASTFTPYNYTTVAELTGKVYGRRDGEVTTDIVDTITVYVVAVER